MADHLISLHDIRVSRQTDKTTADTRTFAQGSLNSALAIDLSRLSARALRKLRDEIKHLRLVLIAASPEGRALIAAEVEKRGRALTDDERIEAIAPLCEGHRIGFSLYPPV